MLQMRNPQLFTPFMAWKGLFQHLEGSPMDDYHEFKCDHEIRIEEWSLYQSPNYVLSLMELWPQVVEQKLLALVQQVEAEVLVVMEPLEMVELLEVVV